MWVKKAATALERMQVSAELVGRQPAMTATLAAMVTLAAVGAVATARLFPATSRGTALVATVATAVAGQSAS
jgi:hypothetical protein